MTKKSVAMLALIASLIVGACSKSGNINEPGDLVPKTVDQDASLPSAMINGALLHTEAFGPADSTLIICIHGGPGSDYRSLLNCMDLASKGYRVVFYDQRGCGLSQRFPMEYYTDKGQAAIDVLYEELKQLIAHYRTHPEQKVVLLGHSWGAMLATAYAARYPQAVQGMVLCEPGGLKWKDILENISRTQKFSITGEGLNDIAYQDQFITGKENDQQILDYKLALQASKNDITGEDETLPGNFWRHGAVMHYAMFEIGKQYEPDFSRGIENYKKHILFLYSEKNRAYTDSWAQKISSVYPDVQLGKIMGTGHDGMICDRTAWENYTMPAILNYLSTIK